MKFRKIFLMALISTLVASTFAGCAKNNASGTSDTSNTSDMKESTKSEDVTIHIWGMGEEAKKLAEIAAPFTEETGYKVDVQAIPWDAAHDKLLTAIASKTGPDVIQLGASWMPEFVNADSLLDLSDYISEYENLAPDNFFEGSVETTQYDGKTYGIPWYTDTRVLYYRTDILESVGYNEAPKTWEELKDVSAKLRARGDDMYGMPWDPKEQSLVFMLANQAGAKFYGTNPDTDFNSKEFIEAATYLDEFFKDGEAPVDLAIVDSVTGMKDDGIIPLFISGPWMINIMNENAPELEGKWATAVLPKGPDNNDSILGGADFTVFRYSENVEASMAFIDYMSKPETQAAWYDLTSSLPANKTAWDENENLSADPLIAPFQEQLKTAKAMPLIPEFEEIAQSWLASFEMIYRGNADIKDVVEEFNETAKELLNN